MKAIVRVLIEDFQSHRLTELELSEGFNVIVGPSDQGKTAILRAIRWVLYNEPKGTDFIRVGSNRAKVTLVMNDGTVVIRERSSSRNRYIVALPGQAEQIYEGFGHTVPEEVMLATGVRPVKIDEDNQVNINLGMQLDPPFLLDSNGAVKAKAIGRINGVHILDYAHKTTSSELNSKSIEERRVQGELEKLEEQLREYDDLDAWQRALQQVEQGLERVVEYEQRIEWLLRKREQRLELARKLELAEAYLARFAALDAASERWLHAQELVFKESRMAEAGHRWKETRRGLKSAAEFIRRTEILDDLANRLQKTESLYQLELAVQKAKNQKDQIAAEYGQVQHILAATGQLDRAEQRYQELDLVAGKEQQLAAMQGKVQEYTSVRRKIELVLAKTSELEAARLLAEQWGEQARKLESLLSYRERLAEHKRQLDKLAVFLKRTVRLIEAEQRMDAADRLSQVLDLLLVYRDRWMQAREEQHKRKQELLQIESKLETLAQQYYEQLKSLGRCPVCLGEIESHTVERIVAEIS